MANNFVWVNATTLNGTFWDNGTLSSASPITQIGTLTLGGSSSSKFLNTQLNNTGTIVENDFRLYFNDGAILNNSGNYELQQGDIYNSSSSIGTFNNSGTFKKTTTGTSTIGVAFNNTGTVNVESGTLNLTGGGVSNGGNFNLTSGRTLGFGGGVYTLNNGAKINGNGNLSVSGGTLDVKLAGGTAIANTVVFTLSGGIFQVDGNWNLLTTNNWNGGTLKSSGIITNSGTLTLGGSSSKYLNTQLNNTGSIVENDYILAFNDGAILNNSGNYELQQGYIYNSSSSVGTFNNSGTFKKTTTGTSIIKVAFNNTGTVNVESGTLNITGGGVSNGGNFNLTSGKTLGFGGGVYTLNNGAKINGNGNLAVSGGTLDVKLAGGTAIANTVVFTLSGGIFQVDGNWNLLTTNNWNGGTLKSSGIITNSGTLTLGGSSSKYLNTQLNNTGSIVENDYILAFNDGAILNNSGNYELQQGYIYNSSSSVGTFNNSGTFKKTTTGIGSIGVAFNNTGTVEAQSGTLNLTNTYTHNNANLILKGGTVTFSNALNINGGSIEGNGSINVGVTNSGLLNPRYASNTEFGLLTINSNYTETNSANINIQLGGTTAGTNFDQVDINGNAAFDGTLNVSLLNNFTPILGSTFDVVTYENFTGSLDFTGLKIADNLTLIPVFNSKALTLIVGNATPKANNDFISTNEDNILYTPTTIFLANDTDGDADPLSIIEVKDGKTIGKVSLNGNQIIYNPNGKFDSLAAGESISDTFDYVVSDPYYGRNTATVTVTVNGVNDAPIAIVDSFSTIRDQSLTLSIQNLLINDYDPDKNDSITFVGVNNAINGSVTLNNNQIIFTPSFEFMGAASFEYVIKDNSGTESKGTVKIDVKPSNFGKIKGTFWQDNNSNGIQDSGELKLGNWTVFLDKNRNGTLDQGEASTITDNQGNYSFDNLTAGAYVVAQVLKQGWDRTYPVQQNNTNPNQIVTPGVSVLGFSSPSNVTANYAPNQILVKLKSAISNLELNTLKSNLGVTNIESISDLGIELWSFSKLSVDTAIAQYSSNSLIEYIEPNYTISNNNVFPLVVPPNDPQYSSLWGLNNTGQTGGKSDADIDAPEAWKISTGSKSIIIGVIDTGVDYTHPDLIGNIWKNPGEIPNDGIDNDNNGFIDDVHGYDFANNDGNPFDDHGHGTHVAGTIGAKGNNNLGVAGINWDIQIMPIKFLSGKGSGTIFNAIKAVNYATKMGANLTNNSWGGGGFSQGLYDAIAAAGKAGQLFVAAAGNSSSNADQSPMYPAAYNLDNIISVAATDHNDNLANFSNYGANSVDLAAPGVNILSTVPGNLYSSFNGTSMASPHVAGVAGLVWANNPSLSAKEVKQVLLDSVDVLDNLKGKTLTGGRLNANTALQNSRPVPGTYVVRLDKGEIVQDINFGNRLLESTSSVSPIESADNTKLVKDTTNKYFTQIGTNTPIAIKNGGQQIYQDIYGSGWQTIAAETVNGDNQVLWKNVSGNYLHIWHLDNNWNWVSSEGNWGLNSADAFTQETNFAIDTNGDGIIGNPYTAIES
ncbi:S8 family serine peptidase, partial [Dolichospermum sp. UHCC 0352]|uniref:S8 family serine peptidase n=1 Tax=Dolichospermum sp. UHCC 0352 TaxID=2590011 RepID=UPI001C2C08B9